MRADAQGVASASKRDETQNDARAAADRVSTAREKLQRVLTALRMAERTREGQVVETSLFEAAIWTQASDFAVTAADEQTTATVVNGNPARSKNTPNTNVQAELQMPSIIKIGRAHV